jgi:hypothetical protein
MWNLTAILPSGTQVLLVETDDIDLAQEAQAKVFNIMSNTVLDVRKGGEYSFVTFTIGKNKTTIHSSQFKKTVLVLYEEE